MTEALTMDARTKPHLPDAQTVTSVTHWTDRLFSFRVSRPATLRFRSGEFVMIGLLDDKGKPLLRAYSIASPSWDEELEFYSIKVPDGPLTSRSSISSRETRSSFDRNRWGRWWWMRFCRASGSGSWRRGPGSRRSPR
jgi:hypothetical protein